MSLIKNLSYSIGDFRLHIPEWQFPDEGVTALTGPSGSGKTTLVKVLCGLLPCPDLVWNFKGRNLAALPPPERGLGVSFQDLRLFPNMSAEENILFAAQARGLTFSSVREEFEEIVSLLGLKGKLSLLADQLSGGERQRVSLARALVCRPRFLLLDEPFAHLDEAAKTEARRLTEKAIAGKGLPALLISHDLQDLKKMAKEILVLKEGSLAIPSP